MTFLTGRGGKVYHPGIQGTYQNHNQDIPAYHAGAEHPGVYDFAAIFGQESNKNETDVFDGWSAGKTGLGPSPGYYDGILGSSTTNSGNTTPAPVNIYYRRSLLGYVIPSATINAAVAQGAQGFTISGIGFYQSRAASSYYSPLPNYAVAMAHLPNGTHTSTAFDANRTDFTTVKGQHSLAITATGQKRIALDTNFSYNGSDALCIIFAWGQCPGNWTSNGPLVYTATTAGTCYYSWTDGSGTYLVTNTASAQNSTRPYFEILVA